MRIAACLLMMGMIFIYPQATADASRAALYTFGTDVLPTLFPYMVLTRILAETAGRKGQSFSSFAALLGMLGGSPSGASVIASLAGRQSMRRCTLYTLCALTGTISPVFLVNTVSLWMGDPSLARLLTISHFSGAALAAGFIYLLKHQDSGVIPLQDNAASSVHTGAISASAGAMLNIGGCLVFFSVAAKALGLLFPSADGVLLSALYALMEIAGGLKALCAYAGHARFLTGVLAAACCGFSGISMLSQNLLFLKPLGITMRRLVLFGLLRALLSASVMVSLMRLF